ncbi:MAG: DUF5916 domain-containing protein [Bacteroidota bacterium]
MYRFFCILLFICVTFAGYTQNPDKSAIAVRIQSSPKIDGLLDDAAWNEARPFSDFRQFKPVFNADASQKTEIRVIYDDNAIYIGAMMYDTAPDSILKQLGSRDDANMNADAIGIEFDTYNAQSDAYSFQITAAGVQSDFREYDLTYNAVWQSAVKILNNGWSAEMKIPYSAIRFPSNDSSMTWGLEVFRYIRRNREYDQWALEDKTASNLLMYWGKLYGITNIKAPVRISFTPYLSMYGEHYPFNIDGKSNYSKSFSGGLDLKYGINESFTLDMILLPDFSQVKSDNIIKNLSAFETIYDELRPFFNEAVDLFEKGGLFYSRRIGHTPLYYYDMEDELLPGEIIMKNPSQAKLLNATKISGRNKNGLAIGILNAVTDNTYAVIEDSLNNTRKILTDPLTNYNIVVFDQVLKNNSDFYIVNTNVTRSMAFDDANITCSGLSLVDRSNTWKLSTSAAISQKYKRNDSIDGSYINTIGQRYNGSFYKIKGNFTAGIWGESYDPFFNANDLGVTLYNNYNNYGIVTNYNIYEPFRKHINMYNSLQYSRSTSFTSGKPTDSEIKYRHSGTLKNYLSYWFGASTSLENLYDYYEPRLQGRYFIIPRYYSAWVGLSSDYRKTLAADLEVDIAWLPEHSYASYSIYFKPIVRVNDKFSFNHSILFRNEYNNIGFADFDTTGNIIFANRDINTIENNFNGKYMFKNDLSLSIWLRHYWNMGKYDLYYILEDDGSVSDNPDYSGNKNFNFNSFNIDLSFSWQFAPGSNVSLVWKNSILQEDKEIIPNYFDNIHKTFDTPQTNSLSLKVLYYLDYQYLKGKKKLR